MLMTIVVLMYAFRGHDNYGANGLILLPGLAHSEEKSKSKSVSLFGMSKYMPKEKHLRTKRLLRMLGNSYDEEWMAIEEPEPSNNVPEANRHSDIIAQRANMEAIRDEISRTMPEYLENNVTVNIISTFLNRMSACRVVFEWEDQGVLFWPRYIKTGTCVSSGTCSWPPGMACTSEGPKTLHILRWRCKGGKNKRSSKKNKLINCSDDTKSYSAKKGKIHCKWKKIPFNVTSQCVCSC